MPRINLMEDLTDTERRRLQRLASFAQSDAYSATSPQRSGSSKFGVFALFVKLGPKIMSVFVKMAKGLKLGKLSFAGASLASYAYMFTWEFAALIMFMLFVHESGHIWAMKRCGVRTKGIYFIPFVGGAAVADDEFPSRGAEMFIAIMGPIWGFGLALLTGVVYTYTMNPLFAAAASWMAMVNLFNLLPINPLDGGRILKSIAFSVHSIMGRVVLYFGIVASGILAFKFGFALFALLLIVGVLDLRYDSIRRAHLPLMNTAETVGSVLAYFAVTGVLWGLMYYMNHVPGAAAAMALLKD